jgi:hypothetical protein
VLEIDLKLMFANDVTSKAIRVLISKIYYKSPKFESNTLLFNIVNILVGMITRMHNVNIKNQGGVKSLKYFVLEPRGGWQYCQISQRR